MSFCTKHIFGSSLISLTKPGIVLHLKARFKLHLNDTYIMVGDIKRAKSIHFGNVRLTFLFISSSNSPRDFVKYTLLLCVIRKKCSPVHMCLH